ncbi:MAG: zinc ABC transporter substrate-binding protein [Thermoleophilia bacterium]|nr:zinc ABC transporter substrate-binding protein [Thermoleophilia bacterium]
MNVRIVIALLVVAAVTAAGCGTSTDGVSKAKPGQTEVVVAFYPLGWLAQQLGGDDVHVTNLTPAGSEPHELELTPQNIRQLQEADVVLYMGHGFQPAVTAALEASDATKIDVLAAPGLHLEAPVATGARQGDRLDVDPHVWLDPVRFARIADYVAGELRMDPAAVDRQLAALDASFRGGLADCVRTDIFTSHAAFGYLADRYGLTQVALTGLSPEAEPKPRDLERIAKQARSAGATTIFFETLVSSKLAEQVAREAGAKAAVLDPLEGIARERLDDGVTYLTVQRENLAALARALGCAAA